MEIISYLEYIQPPEKLAEGFLHFAKEIEQKTIENDTKFSIEEIVDLLNNSLPGKTRANFLLWIGELNEIIESINLILSDLSDLRNNKSSLKGNPVIRSEFLFQAFFGEFFRIREMSKSFIKYLSSEKMFNKKSKEMIVNSYFQKFEWVYEVRNNFIHQGMKFKDFDVNLDLSLFDDLSIEEREKFITLLNTSNTRENTVEIQCALYMKLILEIMKIHFDFQISLNNLLADLILLFEKNNLNITVTENKNVL